MRTYSTKFFKLHKKAITEWYDFSNVKSYKMLSFDSVAEAYGLIYLALLAKISALLLLNNIIQVC